MSFYRNTILTAALFVSASPAVALAQDALPPVGTSIVYLNSATIISQAPGSADAQATFQGEYDTSENELTTQAAVIDSLMKDYQAREVVLSPEAKAQKQQDIRARQQELQTRRSELNERLSERQQDLLKPILEKVSATIDALRAERQYGLIFDVSSEAVVSADSALDVSAEIIRRLTSAAP